MGLLDKASVVIEFTFGGEIRNVRNKCMDKVMFKFVWA